YSAGTIDRSPVRTRRIAADLFGPERARAIIAGQGQRVAKCAAEARWQVRQREQYCRPALSFVAAVTLTGGGLCRLVPPRKGRGGRIRDSHQGIRTGQSAGSAGNSDRQSPRSATGPGEEIISAPSGDHTLKHHGGSGHGDYLAAQPLGVGRGGSS